VYSVTPNGSETVVYAFCSRQDCTDGGYPEAGLIADKNGNFIGTASSGGDVNFNGTVFKLTPDGTETVLYTFCARKRCADGGTPVAGVIGDKEGNLYGTTELGGTHCDGGGAGGCGTVFKLSPDGTETVLHSFNGPDGESPFGNLIADSDGNLYGTTLYSTERHGMGHCNVGCGTVFRIAPDGGETLLHDFIGGSDGGGPLAGLLPDSAGNLYGTTYEGGGADCNAFYQNGCSTLFKIN
jgi:uncharacterized repeat protein (TIGR03803 family)